MGLFDFLKKRQEELPMPPPPTPPEMPPMMRGDIEEIRATEHSELPPALPAPIPAREEEVQVFDRTISKQEEKIETVRPTLRPTFVAVDDYKKIINDTNIIRGKLMEAENFVRRLGDIKNEEERAFEKWRTQLEDVEKKLGYVDQLIAKAER
ncbi:MAG: hypothetical protein NTW67_06245 [Candidatus Woesearchaeota archaeon]|nr:hypothetical protein [Candidatus Woesearchaeota archaeon]